MALNELKSAISEPYDTDTISTAPTKVKWKNVELHEVCDVKDILKFREIFLESANEGKLLPFELRHHLKCVLNLDFDNEDFKLLFLRINKSCTGEIDWDEFVSHLLLGFFTNDPENRRGYLQLPITERPLVLKSRHRVTISRICFSPEIKKDRTMDPLRGNYVTASRDGMINWWSLDLRFLRNAYSSSPNLKVCSTWVTDMICMPDINIIVTSSSERDLRFYDCTANKMTLKLIITSWQFMICTMYYHFYTDIKKNSMLICGDIGGNVRLLEFSPVARGPFQNRPGKEVIQLRHVDLKKRHNKLPGLHYKEFTLVHTDWVRQVSFYESLSLLVSCATSSDSLLMYDIACANSNRVFHVEKGIQCFAFDDEAHVLVTGSPDCIVRVWSPFVPTTPNAIFRGHHTGIIHVILQDNGQKVYSLSRDRVIKVWDVHGQFCLQTYIDIPEEVNGRNPISTFYNKATRELVIASTKIAKIVLDEQMNPEYSDGCTHTKVVSKILYNPLFKLVITCGQDSIIFSWDPVTGKRNIMIRNAHTQLVHGELIPVEITAACLSKSYQLLVTGARNGTLKVWNFNTGTCVRAMSIEDMCEVTNVFWTEGKIFAIGWNRRIVEFEDTGLSPTGKNWELRHTEDVLAAAVRCPDTFATSSYNSEMILWTLETGQPYRQYSCTDPVLLIKVHYNHRESNAASQLSNEKRSLSQTSIKNSLSPRRDTRSTITSGRSKLRRRSSIMLPKDLQTMRQLAVHAMIFLETRPIHMNVGSLLVSLENGVVQCWSDHIAGGLKSAFHAVHACGDYVSAMTTDVNNEYLFTGTTLGYIKVWLMANYMLNTHVHVNMPRLRLEFPFLWRDRVEGRAKRHVRDQPLPLLLNSYRGHLRSITTIQYINNMKLVLSGSSDCSVRVWNLAGEYFHTFGSILPWSLSYPRFPPDVKKVASSTTLKVWQHGNVSKYVPGKKEIDEYRDITDQELKTKTFGKPPKEPILGHYVNLPKPPDRQDNIILDTSLKTTPLYKHLRMASTQRLKRPSTPDLIKKIRDLKFIPPVRRRKT